jgi:hypothetical protein
MNPKADVGAKNEKSPRDVVQRQLDAYNAKDVEALLATYAEDAEQFEYPEKRIARGVGELRDRFAQRFQEPNLRADLLSRIVMENTVIDHERVTRTFPEGPGSVELIAIYEISGGKIAKATFKFGEKRPGPR